MTTTAAVKVHGLSTADANREFSRVLREVREGCHYVVTSHGRPVARIVPIGWSTKDCVPAGVLAQLIAGDVPSPGATPGAA